MSKLPLLIEEYGIDRTYRVTVEGGPQGRYPVVVESEVELEDGSHELVAVGLSLHNAKRLQHALLEAINEASVLTPGPGGAA